MSDKVQFEVVIPARLLLQTEADMVVVPGGDGDFGVLPGHAPLMSTVRPGTIAVYEDDKIVDRIFVAGGFAEVTDERCAVLAEEAIKVSDLSSEDAASRLQAATQSLEAAEEGSNAHKAAELELKIAEAMAEAAAA